MTLCPDCARAERELCSIYNDALCCRARRVAETPRTLMAAAYSAAIDGLSDADAAAVRDRAYAILRAKRA